MSVCWIFWKDNITLRHAHAPRAQHKYKRTMTDVWKTRLSVWGVVLIIYDNKINIQSTEAIGTCAESEARGRFSSYWLGPRASVQKRLKKIHVRAVTLLYVQYRYGWRNIICICAQRFEILFPNLRVNIWFIVSPIIGLAVNWPI